MINEIQYLESHERLGSKFFATRRNCITSQTRRRTVKESLRKLSWAFVSKPKTGRRVDLLQNTMTSISSFPDEARLSTVSNQSFCSTAYGNNHNSCRTLPCMFDENEVVEEAISWLQGQGLTIIEEIDTGRHVKELPIENGRDSPLHFVIKTEAPITVIFGAVLAFPKACGVQGEWGFTPLTLSIARSRTWVKTHKCTRSQFNELVRLICEAAPTSVNLEDIYGKNALEHALFVGSSKTAIDTIYNASAVGWKKTMGGTDQPSMRHRSTFSFHKIFQEQIVRRLTESIRRCSC